MSEISKQTAEKKKHTSTRARWLRQLSHRLLMSGQLAQAFLLLPHTRVCPMKHCPAVIKAVWSISSRALLHSLSPSPTHPSTHTPMAACT